MCSFVGDTKWLLASTEELYATSLSSGARTKPSRHRHKLRIPPVLPSTSTPASTQCEVAFPGNRIYSPSSTDDVQWNTEHPVDVHRTDVNTSDVSCGCELPNDPSHDNDHILRTVSSQLVSDFCNAQTSIAVSDCLNSLNTRQAELGNNCCELVESTDDLKSAANHTIYMENGTAGTTSPEPSKPEKLATFGECVFSCTSLLLI